MIKNMLFLCFCDLQLNNPTLFVDMEFFVALVFFGNSCRCQILHLEVQILLIRLVHRMLL